MATTGTPPAPTYERDGQPGRTCGCHRRGETQENLSSILLPRSFGVPFLEGESSVDLEELLEFNLEEREEREKLQFARGFSSTNRI